MKKIIQLTLLGIVLISCNSKPKSELINSKKIEIGGQDFIYEEVLISKKDVEISLLQNSAEIGATYPTLFAVFVLSYHFYAFRCL